MHPPLSAGGVNLQPNFQKGEGRSIEPQLLNEVAGKEVVTFSGGGLQFPHKK